MTKSLETKLVIKKQKGVSRDYCYAEVHSSGKWNRPVTDKNKKLLGSIGIIRDITEHKQKEKELIEHKEESESIIKVMSGRELRMVELKKEIDALLEELGRPKKYFK